jgi:predicted NBD/HSP70 family sugar kinase
VIGTSRKSGRTPPQIGEHNLRVTLEAIRRDGPLTRAELGLRSGLSGPGITNILRRLREDGLIAVRRRGAVRGGQPVTEFALAPGAAHGIGVALHGGAGEAVVLDLGGAVSQRRRFEAARDPVVAIAHVVDELRAAEEGRMIGVGIGADHPELLVKQDLRDALPSIPVGIERDCVAALFAERTFGIGAVEGGVMLIILSDEVRAGFMFRGLPFAGVHGRAGSIGSMRTGPDHVPLTAVAGLGTLRAMLTEAERRELRADGSLELSPAIRRWIRNAAGHLLDAIVATAGFLAPGAILVGGDVPATLIDELIRQLSIERGDTAIRPFITPWMSPIRRTSFAGAGIAVGAALLPFFDVLLPAPAMPS